MKNTFISITINKEIAIKMLDFCHFPFVGVILFFLPFLNATFYKNADFTIGSSVRPPLWPSGASLRGTLRGRTQRQTQGQTRASERESAAERASEVSSAEQANEFERRSERTSKWPSIHVPIPGCSKPPCTVHRHHRHRQSAATALRVKVT